MFGKTGKVGNAVQISEAEQPIGHYGEFTDEGRTFRLTSRPPRKWRNVHYNAIGGMEFVSECTNIGDGYTWVRDASGNRCVISYWDESYLYIRDEETGVVFCPGGAPAATPVTDFSCLYSAAVTEISGTHAGLAARHRVFVPRQHTFKVWTLFLENMEDRPRDVSIFAYTAFQLTGNDSNARSHGKKVNYARVLPEIGGVFAWNRNATAPANFFRGFICALNGFHAGNGHRDQFMRSEFASGTPKVIEGWNCTNEPGCGHDCAGTVQVKLGVPAMGRTRADFLIGHARSPQEVEAWRKQLSEDTVDAMCNEQIEVERKRASSFVVDVGNSAHNGLFNGFVKKQMYSYLVEKSGFRDNLQIDNAFAMVDYGVARGNFLRALAFQDADGNVPHDFRPLRMDRAADNPAWILMTGSGLVKESGDLALLDEPVRFHQNDDVATVWERMLRAKDHLLGDLGPHGLSRLHDGDWNDGFSGATAGGERESVMVTQQLCYGLLEIAALARRRGEDAVSADAIAEYEKLKHRINQHAWDGEWYLRVLCSDGYNYGSHKNAEGRIFINSQSWAILSGVADEDRGRRCMDSVETHLGLDIGYRTCFPPFETYDPRLGIITNTMPGLNENGGVYNHACGFKAVADCMLGRAEQAWQTFIKAAPDNPLNRVGHSALEPFAFTSLFSASEFNYGKAGNPWKTGTAGWFTVLMVEWILGARRHLDGLLIDPCLSASVPRARLKRSFRGAVFDIELDNTAGRCRGARSIELDGKPMEGNILPDLREGEHKVMVLI